MLLSGTSWGCSVSSPDSSSSPPARPQASCCRGAGWLWPGRGLWSSWSCCSPLCPTRHASSSRGAGTGRRCRRWPGCAGPTPTSAGSSSRSRITCRDRCGRCGHPAAHLPVVPTAVRGCGQPPGLLEPRLLFLGNGTPVVPPPDVTAADPEHVFQALDAWGPGVGPGPATNQAPRVWGGGVPRPCPLAWVVSWKREEGSLCPTPGSPGWGGACWGGGGGSAQPPQRWPHVCRAAACHGPRPGTPTYTDPSPSPC